MILCTETYFKIDLYGCYILSNVIELLKIYCALDNLERAHSSFTQVFVKVQLYVILP